MEYLIRIILYLVPIFILGGTGIAIYFYVQSQIPTFEQMQLYTNRYLDRFPESKEKDLRDALKEKFSRQFFKPDEDQYKLGCLFGAGGLMGVAAAGMFTDMIASAHDSALKKHTDRLVRENFGKRSRRK